MTTDTAPIIAEVHRIYCSLTGTTPNLRLWERDLFEFVQAGFTAQDMEAVLIWIHRENKKASEARYKKSTSLMKLVGDLRFFDAYLCEARAANRNHKPTTPKESVLTSFRGFSERDTKVCARKVGEIINGMNQ